MVGEADGVADPARCEVEAAAAVAGVAVGRGRGLERCRWECDAREQDLERVGETF